MINIAIVEDDAIQRQQLFHCVEAYFTENSEPVRITQFSDGAAILENYPQNPDLILMDIDMPKLDGLEASRRIRTFDADVLLIFITNMIQCALEGYSVDAMDFIVKPVNEWNCRQSFLRALKRIRQRRGHHICLQCKKNPVVLNINEILYAETQSHTVLLHLKTGELTISESMQSLENKTRGFPFFRCHSSFLVNLDAVDHIGRTEVLVAGVSIPVSKYRRAELMLAMTNYIGGTH